MSHQRSKSRAFRVQYGQYLITLPRKESVVLVFPLYSCLTTPQEWEWLLSLLFLESQ